MTRQPPEWTALHFASANGELDAVEMLIAAKADTQSTVMRAHAGAFLVLFDLSLVALSCRQTR